MRRLALAFFCIVLTACRDATGPGIATLTLEVDSQKLDCVTIIETQCLQVREFGSDDWQHFYGEIEGFDWEEGYVYRLQVLRAPVSELFADGPAFRYVLVRVLSKIPASALRAP
jgi:hypothetical protein